MKSFDNSVQARGSVRQVVAMRRGVLPSACFSVGLAWGWDAGLMPRPCHPRIQAA